MILSGLNNVEDLDLTGQEDPILLHAAINTLPIHAAYKEGMMYIREEQYIPRGGGAILLDTRYQRGGAILLVVRFYTKILNISDWSEICSRLR